MNVYKDNNLYIAAKDADSALGCYLEETDGNKVPLADTYYHLNLVPRHFSCEYPIDVYIKGKNLALFFIGRSRGL